MTEGARPRFIALSLQQEGDQFALSRRGGALLADIVACVDVDPSLEAVFVKKKDSSALDNSWLTFNGEIRTLLTQEQLWLLGDGMEPYQLWGAWLLGF